MVFLVCFLINNYQIEGKIQQQAKKSSHFIIQNDMYSETYKHDKGERRGSKGTKEKKNKQENS